MGIVFVERELVREKLNKGKVEFRGRAEELKTRSFQIDIICYRGERA
jgi:hypothetical protein